MVGFLFANDSNKFTGKETNRRNMDTKNWKQSFRLRCLPRFFPLWNKRIYQWIRRAFAMTTHSKQYIGFIFSGKCSSPRDMVMWSKSSMYLYCGAYLFTASHHTRGECSNHFPLCMHISILFVVSSQVVHTCHQTFASQWNTFSCIAFILCTGNTLCHALPKP